MESIKFSEIVTNSNIIEDNKIKTDLTQPRKGEITLNDSWFN